MITVGMDYKIVPGKDAQFVAVCRKVMEIMVDMPGHEHTGDLGHPLPKSPAMEAILEHIRRSPE